MKIKAALNEKGLSQVEFCKQAGISPATLTQVIRGGDTIKYSQTMILRICSELGISLAC